MNIKNFFTDWSERKSNIVVLLIIATAFLVMLSVSLEESATFDESAHIPAGYSYVKYLDYRLNPEHPPLVKVLAGLPLLFMNLNFPDKSVAWTTEANGQWEVGKLFLHESGNDTDAIVAWARVGPMILTLLLILLTYIWSKELLGRGWALLPTIIIGFSPNIIAHGHYVTTDIGATLGITASIYFFVNHLLNPSKRNLIYAGVTFGIAELMKFSAVLLIPYFILLICIFATLETKLNWREAFRKLLSQTRSLFLIFLIGLGIIYSTYFVLTINYPIGKQVSDTEEILQSFSGGKTPDGEKCGAIRCLAEIDIFMASHEATRPLAQYFLGMLEAGQRSAFGNAVYFFGELKNSGGPFYFPFVFLTKEPVTGVLLIMLAIAFWFRRYFSEIHGKINSLRDYLMTHFAEFSMFLFALIYILYSLKSPLNIGLRHLLPIFPIIYILSVASFKSWFKESKFNYKYKIVLMLLIFGIYVEDNVSAYPFYTSYFGDIIQTNNGWKYVTDSNYDWGQDLKRLQSFVESPTNGDTIDKIAVDYFGGGSPKYYLGDKYVNWYSAKGTPLESEVKWLAVSINTLQGAKARISDGLTRNEEDEYRWLQNYEKPYARAGKSIFIYKLQ